jgi:hypothetical protein
MDLRLARVRFWHIHSTVRLHFAIFAATVLCVSSAAAEILPQLRVGRAGHAFDHVGQISEQAEAAAASGATIIYATGLGGVGYAGLPPEKELANLRDTVTKYNREAKSRGIELALGYLCATSIVNLESFDTDWSTEFRAQFETPPAKWRQQDRTGKPLESWYGGNYSPACMNNPDWRKYSEYMVRQQLEAGHDGIFFDNPTVHPQGCYCEHCMKRFREFLVAEGIAVTIESSAKDQSEALRETAVTQQKNFLRYRATIARDFIEHMRRFARSINPKGLVTCNNSLNSPDRLYAQARVHGYNIWELSKAEDLIVVEDMATQPRIEADGRVYEYGPTYKQLHAISHGKPIVAVTLANGDYHTAPNLARLAMAEAAAHGASYLSWPTWPKDQRQRMIDAIRPQADLLRKNERVLNGAAVRADVLLFMPFRRWVDVEHCAASDLAAVLSRANIQYLVVCEDDFETLLAQHRDSVLLLESRDVLTETEQDSVAKHERVNGSVVTATDPNWLDMLRSKIEAPSLTINAPPTVRAIVRDQPNSTIVHLYNLDIQRLSSFEDKVTPAKSIKLRVRVPFEVREASIQSADASNAGPLTFKARAGGGSSFVHVLIPQLDISSIIVFER